VRDAIKDGDILVIYVDGIQLSDRVVACISSFTRRRGLLGRKSVTKDEGVLLVMPERRRGGMGLNTSIHTLGMKFPIAVAWLGEGGEIIHAALARSWRPHHASPRPASYVLEVHAAHISRLSLGSVVSWQPSRLQHLALRDLIESKGSYSD